MLSLSTPPRIAPNVYDDNMNRYHHGDLRQALIRAARELLADAPGEEISLRQIAKRAGVSHAAPYRHFDSVAALLDAVAAQILTDLADRLRSTVRQARHGTTDNGSGATMPALHAAASVYVR